MIELQNRGVRIAPADVFHVGDRKPPNAVRICIGATDTCEELESGLTSIRDALNDYDKTSAIGVD